MTRAEIAMNTMNYLSPSSILFLQHEIPVAEGNRLIDNWLSLHPQESRETLSKLLTAKQVLVKNRQLFDVPQLSLADATKLVQKIQQSGQLDIKERKYQLKHYRSCFVGSELVDYLVNHQNCLVEEAIAIAQSLFEHKLIRHVVDEHEFKNEFLFYSFQLNSSTVSLVEAEALLKEIQQSEALEIKDRWHQLKCYKQCFLGVDLVKYLVKTKDISIAEAISLGQGLIENNMMQHVLNQHDFKNEPLFYKFT